jgi:DNA replication protein DnaC
MTAAVTITDRAGLAAVLRQLKLPGMLATLDARLAQAAAGDLGHLDFLQVLCEDEITRRESVSLGKRIRRARFEEQATLEGFDFTASPKLPAAQIRDLAALRWLHNGESVILYGPVGVGKTHVAQALGHLAIRHGAETRFFKTSRILAHLAGGHADQTWDRRLRELTHPLGKHRRNGALADRAQSLQDDEPCAGTVQMATLPEPCVLLGWERDESGLRPVTSA